MRRQSFRLHDPSDVDLRKWVLTPFWEPMEITDGNIVRQPVGTAADDFPRFHRMVDARLQSRHCPVSDVGSRVMMTARWRPDGSPEPLPLAQILQLLERLTITVPWYPGAWGYKGDVRYGPLTVDRAKAKERIGPPPEVYLYQAALDDFKRQWVEWCWRSHDRDVGALQEYDVVCGGLKKLSGDGRALRYVLLNSVGSEGRLHLGSWSYVLPRYWQTRCVWQESLSDWAETLLAFKWVSNTRAVKEQLRRARTEQRIAATWCGYGDWLCQHPEAAPELEHLLRLPIGGAPSLTQVSAPPSPGHSESANK